LSRDWPKTFTAEMLNKWAGLVGTIERGYDDGVYEYANDLYRRN
jgi:alpha-glucuronidase